MRKKKEISNRTVIIVIVILLLLSLFTLGVYLKYFNGADAKKFDSVTVGSASINLVEPPNAPIDDTPTTQYSAADTQP